MMRPVRFQCTRWYHDNDPKDNDNLNHNNDSTKIRMYQIPTSLLFHFKLPLILKVATYCLFIFIVSSMNYTNIPCFSSSLVVHASATETTSTGEQQKHQPDDGEETCGLYLAASTVININNDDDEEGEDEDGITKSKKMKQPTWGLFAGKSYLTSDMIGYPDYGLNIVNLRHHVLSKSFKKNTTTSDDNEDDSQRKILLESLLEYYESLFWVEETIGAINSVSTSIAIKDDDDDEPVAQVLVNCPIPGGGLLANVKVPLTNIRFSTIATYQRIVSGETMGVATPNRGSITSYYNMTLRATQTIQPGMELFMDVGTSSANDEDENAISLSTEDIIKLDEVITKVHSYFEKYEEILDPSSKQEMYHFLVQDVLRLALGSPQAKEVMRLLPYRYEELSNIIKAGGIMSYKYDIGYHNIEWLKENGYCMDTIESKTSTIPNIGRGAFTTRSFQKHDRIVPIPILHIPDDTLLNMYELTQVEDYDQEDPQYNRVSDEVIGQQILLNYCYGHPESTMLFFPTGPVVGLMNHNTEPNAKLIWSTSKRNKSDELLNKNKEWMEVHPNELMKDEYHSIGLFMELIALRDIEIGEELFIDYGPEWTKAWNEYVTQWETTNEKKDDDDSWPLKAVDMNTLYSNKPYETEQDDNNNDIEDEEDADNATTSPSIDVYPPGVELFAFIILQNPNRPDDNDEDEDADKETVVGRGTKFDPYVWGGNGDGSATIGNMISYQITTADEVAYFLPETLYPIQTILSRREFAIPPDDENDNANDEEEPIMMNYLYTVRCTIHERDIYIKNVPHRAMVFMDKTNQNDQFMVRNPFRHSIGLPDDMIPPNSPWRNKKKNEETISTIQRK